MAEINRKEVLPDDLLEAPLILRKNFEEALNSVKLFIAAGKDFAKTMADGTKVLPEHRENTKRLSDEQRILAQIQKQVAVETIKQSAAYQEQVAVLNSLKQQTKELATNHDLTKKFDAEHASINELTKALQSNRVAYSALRGEHERNSVQGKRLLETIQKQDKSLQELNISIGKVKEESEGLGNSLKEMLEKSGEGGEKVLGIMSTLKGVLVSGWTLAGAAIAGATFAMEQFFEKTEAGEIIMQQSMDLLSIRWDQFKNKIATGIKDALPSDIGTEERTNRLRENTIKNLESQNTPAARERIAELKKEWAVNDEIYSLTVQRHEVEEEEIPLIVKRIEKLDEAAKLELKARESFSESIKVRIKAITEANKLYLEVQEKDIEFATKRVGIANQEIYLRAVGRELLPAERKQIELNIASVVQLQLEYDKAAKRRIAFMEKLKSSDAKPKKEKNEKTVDIDFSKESDALRKAVKKQTNDELLKETKELNTIIANETKNSTEDDNRERERLRRQQEERDKLMYEKRVEFARAASDAIVRTVEQQYDAQIQKQESYLRRLKENYQEEMQMSSGNKIAQAQLTAKFREQEKLAEAQVRKEKLKMAKFEKEASALTVIIKTAEAVMKDVAMFPETAGQPFATIDEGIGALQLAAILSKPLPSYEVGTNYHKGGKAVVGEKGFELYSTPSGEIGFTPNETSIMELPVGSQVETHDDTLRILALAGLKNSGFDTQVNFSSKIIDKLDEVKTELKNQKNQQTEFHKMLSGYYAFQKQNENFTKRVLVERYGNTI